MKRLSIILLIIFAFILLMFGSGCNTISPKLQDEYMRPGLSQGMCSVFDKYRQRIPKIMAGDKVPGLSLALVDREGILWAAGFGYTDYDLKTPVTTDTMFAICSISKTITATAVMIAVQDGLLEMDVPIIEYWPQFTVNSRFEEDPQKKITLRHLLTHTSGIAFEAPVGNGREPSYGTLEKHGLSVCDTWLRHKVGERYSYSGLGYDIAAYILQLQSGQPFAKYIEEKIFTPLNMSNCSVDPEFIRNHPNRAIGHKSYVEQLPIVTEIPLTGGAGVYADVKSMANFVQLFLNDGRVNGQEVLDARLIAGMFAPPQCFHPSEVFKYGLGVEIHYNEYVRLGHDGGGYGFMSAMRWLPEYGLGIVVLINSEEYNTTLYILSDLIDENHVQKSESFEIPSGKYQPWQKPDPNTFTRFKPEWKKYIGTYKYILRGWKFDTILNIALALGLTHKNLHVKVFEEDGYLHVDSHIYHDHDGGRLDEYLPGLFFTPTGKCLDLRGPTLTWQNYRIKKINNDNNRKFNLN